MRRKKKQLNRHNFHKHLTSKLELQPLNILQQGMKHLKVSLIFFRELQIFELPLAL